VRSNEVRERVHDAIATTRSIALVARLAARTSCALLLRLDAFLL
jgi:hypothetical protein